MWPCLEVRDMVVWVPEITQHFPWPHQRLKVLSSSRFTEPVRCTVWMSVWNVNFCGDSIETVKEPAFGHSVASPQCCQHQDSGCNSKAESCCFSDYCSDVDVPNDLSLHISPQHHFFCLINVFLYKQQFRTIRSNSKVKPLKGYLTMSFSWLMCSCCHVVCE